MVAFIIRRLLWMVVLLLVISALTFLIFYELPSADPALLRAGRQPTPELVASIRETLGLDDPVYVQYAKYLEKPRLPLRLRLQLPEQRLGPGADLRPHPGDRCRSPSAR